MREANAIAGKRSDVGGTFTRGGCLRNYRPSSRQAPLICVGVGVQSGIQRSSSESSNLCNIGMLPSLTWPKSFSSAHREKRYGLKSTVGNDCTFTKGGSSRNFATETCQISEINRPSTSETPSPSEDLFSSATNQMPCTPSRIKHSQGIFFHGIGSTIGVESTFAKGGSRRNYKSNATKTRLAYPEDGAPSFEECIQSTYSVTYPPSVCNAPRISNLQDQSLSFGVKSDIGHDTTSDMGGTRRIFQGPKSQVHFTHRRSDGQMFEEISAPTEAGPVNDTLNFSTQLWLDSNSSCYEYGYGRKSDVGHENTFDKGGSRRNFTPSEIQVSIGSLITGIDSFCDADEPSDYEVKQSTAESIEHLDEELSKKHCGIRGLKSTIGLTDFTGGTKKLFVHPYSQVNLSPLPVSTQGSSLSDNSVISPWSKSHTGNSADDIFIREDQAVVKLKMRNRSRGK